MSAESRSVALIGLGKMGLSHLAIANATNGLEVVAICDSSRLLVSALEKNTRIPGYTNHIDMLDSHRLDGVIISVPNEYHYGVAIDCIDRAVNVFIEKPLALRYEHSMELVGRAKTKGVFGQVGYVNRYNPVFAHARHLVSTGVIGEIRSYKSCMIGGVVLDAGSKGWRNDYERGGGCLFDYGPHCLDLVNFLVNGAASITSANLRSVHSTKVDDIVEARLQHENGAVGEVFVNWSDASYRKADNRFEATGSKGALSVDKQEIRLVLDKPDVESGYVAGENRLYVTDLDTHVGFYLRGEDFSRQMQHFSDQLADRRVANLCSLADGAETDRLIRDIFDQAAKCS